MRNVCVLRLGSRTLCPSTLTHYALRITHLLQSRRPLRVVPMALVEAGEGELAQLMAHHVLGDVDRNVAAAIVHAGSVAHHVGGTAAGARPGLDQALLVPGVHPLDLVLQVLVYVRSFFRRTSHLFSILDFGFWIWTKL